MLVTLQAMSSVRQGARLHELHENGLIRFRILGVTALLTKGTAMIAGSFAAGLFLFHESGDICSSLVSLPGTSKMLRLSNYLGTFLPS